MKTFKTLNDHRTLSTFSSGRDDTIPHVGFKLWLQGDLTGEIEHRMSLDEWESFKRQMDQQRDYVVEFEAQRGKKRAA